MKLKELEIKIAALEKEIAELKKREPVVINFPANPVCPMQHYPSYPQPSIPYFPPYPNPNYPINWCGDIPQNYTC
jgi:hypothetical protein